MKKLVWNDPTGHFVIQHASGDYFTDGPSQGRRDILSMWTRKPGDALHFASAEDASIIAAGLVERKTVAGGLRCYSIKDDGNIETRLTVIELPE